MVIPYLSITTQGLALKGYIMDKLQSTWGIKNISNINKKVQVGTTTQERVKKERDKRRNN
jgi:hypothetical protein